MNRTDRPAQPPPLADALLQRWLPDGVLGLSILGDLHQEFEELAPERSSAASAFWYWRAALGLSARYAGVRIKDNVLGRGSGGSMGVEMMTTWWADLRYGFRMLLKTPLLSIVAVITVGLGVGLTTHTFSSVYGAVIRGVPVPDSERLMFVGATRLDLGITQMEMSVHDFEDLRAQQSSFDDLAAFYQGTANMAGEEAPPERFAGAYVSDNMFSVLGVLPELGRTFLPGEDDVDAPSVVVIGHHVWQNRFAADPRIVGKTIRVNGQASEIVGVMPEGFRFPFLEDVWLPHRIDVAGLERGRGEDLDVFGRIREGTTLQVARAELAGVAAQFAAAYPESNENLGLNVTPYDERFMPPEITSILWVMLAATFGVLLIACANVTNLLMARASVRSREIAIRTALGAGRWRMIRQLLMESLVLAIIGGAVGLLLAWGGVEAYNIAVADIYKPYWVRFAMDPAVLLFSLGTTGLASLAAGILPAVRASGVGIGENLKDESRGSSSLRMGRMSSMLVVTEIAVSCALLIGAGFMIQSIVNLKNVDLGFETEGVMTGRIGLFDSDYPDQLSREQFFLLLKERLEEEPGVVSAALGSNLPGLGGGRYYASVMGTTYATDRDHPVVTTTVATQDFFSTLGVPLLQGRDFTSLEARVDGEPVVIVNESFAETYLDGTANALGSQVRLGLSDSERAWRRVIGVVPDMHVGGNVGGIGDDQVRPERLFLPQGALDMTFMSLAILTSGDPTALAPALRDIVVELDPNLPVYELQPLGQAVENATWAFGLFGSLFTIVGAAALFLAAVGLYGVMAFGVTQRRQEMGVRMALGAGAPQIIRMVLRRGMVQLAIGTVIGIGLGAGMSWSMRIVLYGVETSDARVYVVVVATLLATGLLATFLPARSATRTDPVEAMRGA